MIVHELFVDLIRGFLNHQIDANIFCERFTELWKQHRDAMHEKKKSWLKPYDEILIAAFQRGEIADNEFSEKFAHLWGYSDALPMQNMIDAIHSSCSIFRSVPELSWEIDESRLRIEVAQELASYELNNASP